MSDSDEEPSWQELRKRFLLECEDCRAVFPPQQFGCEAADDLPRDVMCPRCGAPFCVVDPD